MTIGQPFNPFRIFTGIFIPEALCRTDLVSWQAKGIYGRLCRYAGESGEAYPAVATLGKEVGLSESQCKIHLHSLIENGFLQIEERPGKTRVYLFLWHEIFEGVGNPTGLETRPTTGSETRPPGGRKPDPEESQEESHGRESHSEATKTKNQLVESAKSLYQNHPAKRRCSLRVIEKKLHTIIEVQKLKPEMVGRFLTELVARHERWCDSEDWTKDDGQYAKSLEAWLNPEKELYLNEPTTRVKNTEQRFYL